MCQKKQEPSLAGPGAPLGGIGGTEPEPSWTRSEASEPSRKINKIHVARQESSENTSGTPYAGARIVVIWLKRGTRRARKETNNLKKSLS